MSGSTTPEPSPAESNNEVKAPEGKPEEGSFGSALWKIIGSNLGGDVLRIGVSLPSWMYEPLSSLQRQAEMVEYGHILTKASKCADPLNRMAHVVGFAVSGYSATKRVKPTFNPLLGETFEYVDKQSNTKFFTEQVSHHPPISALHVEGEGYRFLQNSSPKTKFLGNAIDIITQGNSHVYFPQSNEHIHYENPCTRCNSIIIGSRWIEHFGQLNFKNLTNGVTCSIEFRKAGLFQGPQFDITGFVCDKDGRQCIKIEGRWDEFVTMEWLVDSLEGKKGEKKEVWRITSDNFVPGDQYGFSKFTTSLNTLDEELDAILPTTDSRRRLDRMYLEKGKTDVATTWKRTMEDRQRADRRNRKEHWVPTWFKEDIVEDCFVETANGDGTVSKEPMKFWKYVGNYWEQRDKQLKTAVQEGLDFAQTIQVPSYVHGLACDFANYESKSTATTETNITDTDSDTENKSNSSATFNTTATSTNN